MHLRHRRTVAALAALSVTTPALLALASSPASAGTGGGALLCKTTTLAPPPQDAPLIVHVTANPSGPKAPTGATIPVNGATVTLTLPGIVVGNLKGQANAGTVGLNQGILKLDATHATGALQVSTLTAPAQTITGYLPDPDGAGPGQATADPITFTVNNVNFGTLTTSGANGQSVDISLAASSAGDGFIFSLGGGAIIPTLGFGSLNSGLGGPGGGGVCANDTTGTNGPWAASIASVALAGTTVHSFTNTAKPTVTGTVKVGKKLTCKTGSWSPSPATTTIQWLRDGKAIKKATKAKYKIVKADAKHKLSCSVTVSSPGYTSATATSGTTKKVPTPPKH